ncbi:hypothetical protein Q2298_08475 [Rhodococcus electrodiphilus]|uniref:hypothetical protein n=1 Tax=Rhodococcus ruber TaxID=1830 RepID=UPI0026F42994|nr:hypothetical protein [Rhodococcus ruber]MDO2378387.1 hypothetical protein [Rhodococcus ruber]
MPVLRDGLGEGSASLGQRSDEHQFPCEPQTRVDEVQYPVVVAAREMRFGCGAVDWICGVVELALQDGSVGGVVDKDRTCLTSVAFVAGLQWRQHTPTGGRASVGAVDQGPAVVVVAGELDPGAFGLQLHRRQEFLLGVLMPGMVYLLQHILLLAVTEGQNTDAAQQFFASHSSPDACQRVRDVLLVALF